MSFGKLAQEPRGNTYAKAGGPPVDWIDVSVTFNGDKSSDWIEVDSAKGWGIRYKRDERGELVIECDDLATERVEGNFVLDWKHDNDGN